MKHYRYDDTSGSYTKSEEEIISEFWETWSLKMMSIGKFDLVTRERCIQDWVTVNWAWELQ